MTDILALDFMRYALVAALLVGIAAPLVGVFLVQRRMSLIGDGMGHVALAGVAIGALTGQAPILTALIAALIAAVAIELIRARGRTAADQALAIMFYGGIALGVVVISKASGASSATLTNYLFGAILTTSREDLVVFTALTLVIFGVVGVLHERLFAVASDEEYARAVGLPVTAYNIVLACLTAVTVVVAMRVVGLLLISALMIVPTATANLVSRSFAATIRLAVAVGIASSIGGVVLSFYAQTPSGGTIVLLAITAFAMAAGVTAVRARIANSSHARAETHTHEHGPDCGHKAVPHGDHVDYLHDGHRHAPHKDHWDEHHSRKQVHP